MKWPILGALFLAIGLGCGAVRAEDLVKKLLIELDHEDFARRGDAQRQLRQLGERVLPDLRSALQQKTVSLELRTRLETLLKDIQSDVEKKQAVEQRRRAFVKGYHVKDILGPTDESRSPQLTFGGDISIYERFGLDNQAEQEKQLANLVKTMVDSQSWDGDKFTVTLLNNTLIVSQTIEAHERIAALLDAIRAERQPTIAVTCLLLQLKNEPEKNALSGIEMDAVIKDASPEAVALKARLLGANSRRAVAIEGKQFEYIHETMIANTEGGGNVGGVRTQYCLQGYAITVLPRLSKTTGDVQIDLRFYRNVNLQMREIGAMEKYILDKSESAPNAAKTAAAIAKKEGDAASNKKSEQWVLPSADLQAIHAELSIPRGMWLCAGRLAGEAMQEAIADKKGFYLFIKAEPVEPLPAPGAGRTQ